ncbi:MAG: hypothetical protein AAF206_17160, partial [Bacteroidota bacterium]
GKAELTSYTLDQSRYGEVHPGHAVLVFVTEDFSRKKQVKLDYPSRAGADKVPILKLNFTKKFLTGIYPYSLMNSVFTPIDVDKDPHSLKMSTSVQEWCGHVFTQMNLREKGYDFSQYSYFEGEGDVQKNLPKAMLEDEIWNRLRIDPSSIPTGKVELIPSMFFSRLRHTPLGAAKAEISFAKAEGEFDEKTRSLIIKYPDLNRQLVIYFNKAFPYEIQGWDESYPGSPYGNARALTTKARLNKRIQSAYWGKNGLADRKLRAELGL